MLDPHLRFLFGLAPDGLRKSPLVLDSLANPVIALCRPRRRGTGSAIMFAAFPMVMAAAFASSTMYIAHHVPGGAFAPEALAAILAWFVLFGLFSAYPVSYFSVRWFAVWRPARDWLDELAATPLRRGEVALAHYVWGLSAAVRVMGAVALAFVSMFGAIGAFALIDSMRSNADLETMAIIAAFTGPLLLYVTAVVPLALDRAVADVAQRTDSRWGWMNLFVLDWAHHVAKCSGYLIAIIALVFLTGALIGHVVRMMGVYAVLAAGAASAIACWLAVGPVLEVVATRLAEHRHREVTDWFWEANEEF